MFYGGNLTRRSLLTIAGAGSVGALAGCSSSGSKGSSPREAGGGDAASSSGLPTPIQLPNGGREIFPAYRLFGYCGSPAGAALGQLGVGDLADEAEQMMGKVTAWDGGRRVQPVMELISCIVQSAPGADGQYRIRLGDDTIRQWLDVARQHKALLLLNIQPGRATFLDEVKAVERWLREPDVGLALDPEWSVGPGQTPGKVFGHTTGQVLDDVASYVSGLVTEHKLPEKPMVIHVLRRDIVSDESALRPHPGVALVKSVDGIGPMHDKVKAYNAVMAGTPPHIHPGFKLFFQEDGRYGPLMTPDQVLALTPQPEYVLYE
ncbi:hypothetical protein HJ588_02515 [Flexivirga sp. ID2601S]|uniref:Lipoprotein n=1 Tax=Flexivirga aerilata TaxID=1656889 RepID=A0A849AEZ7_9MICO|nr:hypothetical protein [Flexivirga aerilata]NNG38146.1 hypothetical protein [Flexivirga aerilata]